MMNDVMPSIIQMEAEELQQLTAEVKETLATSINLKKERSMSRTFGIADMWNIRRTARSANGMMRR